jgi:hypothetical protein
MPPLGAGLYAGPGSMSLGFSGTAAQMHGFADQAGQSSSAAAGAAVQFDHIMPSSSGSSSMFRSQASASASSSYFLGGGAPPAAQDFSEDGSQGSQGALLHGKAPFHGLMQLPEQHHQPGPGSSNAAVANGNNLLNLGFFSAGNGGGTSGGSQDARLVIQDQFNVSGAGGSGSAEHGNVMASLGSHLGGGFPSLYNNSSPSAGLAQNSATALLMKAAQMGSTSSTSHNGALLRATGFSAGSGQGTTTGRAAGEGTTSHEAHFHQLIMNSLAGGSGTGGFSGTAGFGGVDDGKLSTRDFLGVGRGAMAPPGLHIGALDPAQMK